MSLKACPLPKSWDRMEGKVLEIKARLAKAGIKMPLPSFHFTLSDRISDTHFTIVPNIPKRAGTWPTSRHLS